MRLPAWLQASYLSWFGCLLCLSSLSTSKALQSISIGILGAGALWQLWEARSLRVFRQNPYAWWLSGILLLTAISYFYTEDSVQWGRDMKGKLLFCVIPLALGGMTGFSQRLYRVLWYAFILCQTIVAGISLGRYFGNYTAINEAIGKNASIDIIGNMSHIYFGLLLALAVVLGLYLGWQFVAVWWSGERWIIWVISALNIVFLHILTSRTGLLTFYAGIATIGLWLLVRQRKIWPILTIGVILVVLPWLSYQLFPSFKQRVDVTIWDVQQFQYASEDAADYSLAARLMAWQTAAQIFLDQPLLGTGIADIEQEMIARAPDNVPLDKRLNNPHNEYLELGAAFGLPGLVWLLGFLFLPWNNPAFRISWLAVVFLAMYATGMVFESLLERQVGICLYCFFAYLFVDFQQIEHKNNQISSKPLNH